MDQNKKQNKSKNSKGFYIAVCCCVFVIGVTGYISNRNKNNVTNNNISEPTQQIAKLTPTSKPKANSTEQPEKTELPAAEKTPAAIVTSPPSATKLPEQKSETVINDIGSVESDVIETGEPAEFYEDNIETSISVNSDPDFIMPIEGEIAEGFSGNNLIFNSALGDWRTHNGIDIVSDSEAYALAAADGLIKDVYSDYYGNTVVISHSNGFETLYACLKNIDGIEVGQSIKQGDRLSTLSEVCTGENVTKPHLHFEIIKQGQPVNPEEKIKL